MSFLYSTPLCFRDQPGSASNVAVADAWHADQCKLLHETEALPAFWIHEHEFYDSVLFGITEIRDILVGGGSIYLVEDSVPTEPWDEFYEALYFDAKFQTYSVRTYGVRY